MLALAKQSFATMQLAMKFMSNSNLKNRTHNFQI